MKPTEVTGAVDAWCHEQSVDEVEARLLAAGIPVARVRTPAEALMDPVVNERREGTSLSHPDLGVVPGLKTIGPNPLSLHPLRHRARPLAGYLDRPRAAERRRQYHRPIDAFVTTGA